MNTDTTAVLASSRLFDANSYANLADLSFNSMSVHTGTPTDAWTEPTAKRLYTTMIVGAIAMGGTSFDITDVQAWLPAVGQPDSAVAWDNAVLWSQHPTLSAHDVSMFMRNMPGADLRALQSIYDLAAAAFGDIPDLHPRYRFDVDADSGRPLLFLNIDTHGMDTDEQLKREVTLHEKIFQDDSLKSALTYHVVSVY